MLSAAQQLARLGLPCHWLHPPKEGGKAPLCHDWQLTPYQAPEQLAERFERARHRFNPGLNCGIRTGWVEGAPHCVVVVDFDSAEALAWGVAHLPPTPLRARTSAFEHWYYAHPRYYPGLPGLAPTRARVGRMALDIRGEGGQVVCPPSVHPSGAVYRWVDPPTEKMLFSLPPYDPAFLPQPPPQPPALVPSPIVALEGSQRRALARARGAARKWRVLPDGQGAGTQTYALACMLLHGLSLSSDEAFSILAAVYNPRLEKPYSPELLRRKVTEAQRAQRANRPLIER